MHLWCSTVRTKKIKNKFKTTLKIDNKKLVPIQHNVCRCYSKLIHIQNSYTPWSNKKVTHSPFIFFNNSYKKTKSWENFTPDIINFPSHLQNVITVPSEIQKSFLNNSLLVRLQLQLDKFSQCETGFIFFTVEKLFTVVPLWTHKMISYLRWWQPSM